MKLAVALALAAWIVVFLLQDYHQTRQRAEKGQRAFDYLIQQRSAQPENAQTKTKE